MAPASFKQRGLIVHLFNLYGLRVDVDIPMNATSEANEETRLMMIKDEIGHSVPCIAVLSSTEASKVITMLNRRLGARERKEDNLIRTGWKAKRAS